MSRSPYAVTSALVVACPPRSEGGCGAAIGEPCWTLRVDEESFTRPKLVRVNLKRVHSARAAKPAKESPQKPINPFMNTSFYDVRDFWKP